MNDHYKTLGVNEHATPDEIKKAYRSLANKHHPDKGGDQAKFKDISVAYDTLSDSNKKAEYDQMRRGGPQVKFSADGFRDFNDIFGRTGPFGGGFGDIFGHQRGIRRNRDLNIQCQISFIDSYNGKQLEASYKLPSGKHQTVVINVPSGIDHGATIRYQGLGDDSIMQAPRGDLNVTILIQPSDVFERRGHDLYTTLEITPIEAMIGCKKFVTTISGTKMPVDVRAGVESGVEYASNGHGFPVVNTDIRGRFVTVIKIKAPSITDPDLVARLKALNDEISNLGLDKV